MDFGKILLWGLLGLGGFGMLWLILSLCRIASGCDVDMEMRMAARKQVERDTGYDIGRLTDEQWGA